MAGGFEVTTGEIHKPSEDIRSRMPDFFDRIKRKDEGEIFKQPSEDIRAGVPRVVDVFNNEERLWREILESLGDIKPRKPGDYTGDYKIFVDLTKPVDCMKPGEKENVKDDADSEQARDADGVRENDSNKDVNPVRELTDEEKARLKEKTGWPDKKFDKCTIDKDGVIHYKTDRCDLEGKTSDNGVPYERKQVIVNGVKIEGVFPVFKSAFDTELSPDKYKSNAYAGECNAKLKEAIQNNPELGNKFTKEQLQDIKEGKTPRGYVWHHNEEPGKMQLVKHEDHDRCIGAAHTGGNSLWGADSVDKKSKGENF